MVSIANTAFSDDAWTQASFPVRMGGLGIRKSEDIALPAYISSSISTYSLVDSILKSVTDSAPIEITHEIEQWKASGEELIEPQDEFRARQRAWDTPRIEQTQKSLIAKADQVSRARLLAAEQPESGAWATAIPVPSLGTQLNPEELRIAIALRTGSEVCVERPCKCGKIIDKLGYHSLSCNKSEGRSPRHTAINEIIWRALKAAEIKSRLEPEGIDRGDNLRPDGLTSQPFSQGKALCWDATCVDTFCESYVHECATVAGSAATKAEIRKRNKYQEMGRRYKFEPIAIETTGVYGSTTRTIIKEIGKRISDKTGDIRESLWFRQRLSIAIQRGNAQLIQSPSDHIPGLS